MKNAIVLSLLLAFSLLGYSQDKLSNLRTAKQIITVDSPTAPYYAIQILALKLPPSDANFFKNFDEVREFPCEDGYVRYCVGRYSTFAEANADLQSIRAKGYNEAFVTNTKRYSLAATNFSSNKIEIVAHKDYVVQLSAFRYPVYLTHFENVDDVLEYRMNDKIFRYTTSPCKGTQIESVLSNILSLGYKNAFIVDYERYAPYRIE